MMRSNPDGHFGGCRRSHLAPTWSWGESSEQGTSKLEAEGTTKLEVMEGTHQLKGRTGETKEATKDEKFYAKLREGGLYAQTATTDKMAEAQMLKAVGLVNQNLILLITTNDSTLVHAEVKEYVTHTTFESTCNYLSCTT